LSIKKLAGQTLWYGLPTVGSRFIGYILNFSLIYLYQAADTADITQIYAIIPFLNILFTYGVETAYFRFVQEKQNRHLYSTLTISVFISSVLLSLILLLFSDELADATYMKDHPEYFRWMTYIIFFDTLAALPFARLRQEGRPKKYAFVKLTTIIINVLVVIYYLGICPNIYKSSPESILLLFYDPELGIGYYLIGNLIGSLVALLLLRKELFAISLSFDFDLWKRVVKYAYPLIIVGLGGMINEMLSRVVYLHVTDLPVAEAKHQLGVFAANFRLAVLITIFIQMFRMAAEPFFFNQSKEDNAKRTYARVMKFFVIACCIMFLGIGLFLDLFRELISLKYESYGEGIHIVPILAMASVFLGIYYNLSVWYKLTNKNLYGAAITVAGAFITVLLNILWIPKFGYTGSAWATFVCYAFMMIASYVLGQKHYPIPYARKKLISYLVLTTILYFIHKGMMYLWSNYAGRKSGLNDYTLAFSIITGGLVLCFFLWFVGKIEKKELSTLPLISKLYRTPARANLTTTNSPVGANPTDNTANPTLPRESSP
jgi:O-antigen/teichoic acid export membrane protein